MSGLFISASGMINALRRNDITANNIANLRTAGFRAVRARSTAAPGGGVTLGGTSRSNAQGPIEITGAPLDVAAPGNAFFKVRRPNGAEAFTRAGHFSLNADGQVVTIDGNALDPPIQAPPNATSVTVTSSGAVFATVPGEAAPRQAGQIEVFQFNNPGGLESIGGSLFQPTAASGQALAVTANTPFLSGAITGSNVDLTTEQVNRVLNRQAFQANLQAFRVQDEILGELLDRGE